MYGKVRNADSVKKTVEKAVKCPDYGKKIIFGIELAMLQRSLSSIYFPHIHGKPLHGLLYYIFA